MKTVIIFVLNYFTSRLNLKFFLCVLVRRRPHVMNFLLGLKHFFNLPKSADLFCPYQKKSNLIRTYQKSRWQTLICVSYLNFHAPQQCQAFYEKKDEKKVRESVWGNVYDFIKNIQPSRNIGNRYFSLFRYRFFKYHREINAK